MLAPDPTRLEIGYWLSSEEHSARALVRNAVRAEEMGFGSAMISDHYHPWTDRQGQSPFVWSVLGAIAGATERLAVGTGVTAPVMRLHPAIVAQAAVTVATLMPERFFLGVGSGERLNEHVVGSDWPPAEVRFAIWRKRSISSACCGEARSTATGAATSPSTTRASIRAPTCRCRSTSPPARRGAPRPPDASAMGWWV